MKKDFLVSACVVSCFVPSYLWYVRRIIAGGESGLSVVICPLVLWLVYKEEAKEQARESLTILGIMAYALCWLFHVPALVKAVLAITVLLQHFRCLNHFGIASLSYLTLPWLDSLQFFLGYPLRRLVAEVSTMGLRSFSLDVTVSGTGLVYQGHQVFVDPPCSGIKMLWAGTILCAILLTFCKLNWKQGILLYIISGLLLILANTVRGMILFFPEAEIVHWPEWTHQSVGLILYTLCVGALLTISQKLPEFHEKT